MSLFSVTAFFSSRMVVGFQAGSKLTIGLEATSLTALGVGKLGLLSHLRLLVAALISSLLISRPSDDNLADVFLSSVVCVDESTV